MSNSTYTQKQIFKQIQQKHPSNSLVANEIAELLNVSNDSAYRRMRGEKSLSLEELVSLSKHYDISIDQILNSSTNNVTFDKWAIDTDKFSFKNWVSSIAENMKMISEQKEKEIIYAAKATPIYHIWNIPEIAAFKVFFWQKTILQLPEYTNMQYSFDNYDNGIQKIGEKILDLSLKIPIIEIWNEDTFNILLKQIEYYLITDQFEYKEDIVVLYDSLEKLIRHIQKQAEMGFNFKYGNKPMGTKNTYRFYTNDVILNDNTMLVNFGELKTCYITYNVLNVLRTTDPAFTRSTYDHLNGIIKESTMISISAEKNRLLFFNKLVNKIIISKNSLLTN